MAAAQDGPAGSGCPDTPQPTRKAKIWRKILRRIALVGLCLVVGGYAGLKFWLWVSVPGNAPLIGVSWDTAWHARVGITTINYEVALTRSGGRILELRPGGEPPEDILDRIDALLLSGGGDVDPELYEGGATGVEHVDRKRDDFELALIRGALRRDMPILGVCRGIQILNVAQGGTLRTLRDHPKLAEAHGIGLDSMDAHPVEIAGGSKLAKLVGAGRRGVNSFHGQAVGRVGRRLKVAAKAPDGVVEALELPSQTFVIATQWHPAWPRGARGTLRFRPVGL